MAHLVLQLFFGNNDIFGANGLWLFLSVGAVALFGIFIPTVTWIDSRRKEREAFYKAETFRRMAESSGDGAKAAVNMLREEEWIRQIKIREGLKIAGLVNVGVGIALVIFLRAMLHGDQAVYLCGLIPAFVGAAFLLYVYVMASPIEKP